MLPRLVSRLLPWHKLGRQVLDSEDCGDEVRQVREAGERRAFLQVESVEADARPERVRQAGEFPAVRQVEGVEAGARPERVRQAGER